MAAAIVQYFRGPDRRHFRAAWADGSHLEMWWDAFDTDRMYVYYWPGPDGHGVHDLLPCPRPMIDAFEQDPACPAEPVLDYLLEANPDLEWLHRAVARLTQGAVT